MIIDAKIAKLLEEIRHLLDQGFENCFGIMALCNNCQSKCDKKKKREILKQKIDKILEV